MSYKCNRSGCGKVASFRGGLRCYRCDTQTAAAQGVTPIYTAPPSYFDTSECRSDGSSPGGFRSWGGGDFGGGGASVSSTTQSTKRGLVLPRGAP